ncbi:MAG: PKD domain-containing protein [Bacteroidia bacterium]
MHTLIFEQTITKMMNTIHKLVIAILLFSCADIKAQCPIVTINAPDSACKGTSVLFSNSSTGNNLSYNWDFLAGDTKGIPTGGLTGNYPAEIGFTAGVDFLVENNNIIAISIKDAGELIRINYGDSLSNIPTLTYLGNLNVIGGGVRDIELVEDNGNYYGLTVSAAGQMFLIDFGSSLLNTPTGTMLTIPNGTLANPFRLDINKMGNEFVCMVANLGGGNVTVLNFGTSMMNSTPTTFNITVPSALPISTALINDCGHYYGVVAYLSGSPFTVIDFGSTITSTPIQIQDLLNTSNFGYRKINALNDGYNWLILGNTYGGLGEVHIYNFGGSFNNLSPNISFPGTAGAFGPDFWAYNVKKFESVVGGIVYNYSSGDISYFKFPQTDNVTQQISTSANPNVTFNDTGLFIYTLSVTDTLLGISSNVIDSIYISEAPTSSFVTGTSCSSYSTLFNSTSSGNPVLFNWDFGDGQTGSGDSTNHIYSTAGNYNVSLIAITDAGCSDTSINTIPVYDPPQANFNFLNNQCAGASCQFTDISTTSQGSISNWTWVFNSMDTLTGSISNYIFNSDGQYPVQLFIQASTGCLDTIQQFIDIIPGPINSFSVTNTCLGEISQFVNTTSITGGLTVDYEWIFNTNDTSLLVNPSFAFPSLNAANYTIFLTATSSNGCEDTLTEVIHIGEPALVDFSIDDDTVCSNSLVLFSDSSIIPAGEVMTKLLWDFGDGTLDSIQSTASHFYSNAGAYTITLTIQTESHCIASVSKVLQVIESPTSIFSFSNVCNGINANFIDLSTSSALTQISSWNWNFGDTIFSNLQNPVHLYPDSGTYTVSLIATDNNGCYDSSSQTITIYATPRVYFSNSKSCTYNATQFTDSTVVGAGISSYLWNFGDGSATSSLQNPQHTYSTTAAYPVTLISTSTQGCIDSTTQLVLVDYSPEFQLVPSTSCLGLPNQFNYTNTGIPVTNSGYSWNFGDSTASSQPQPSHQYITSGPKTVTFTLTNLDNGCSTTDSIIANVIATPTASFISDSSCIGDSLHLLNTSSTPSDPITQWIWTSNFGSLAATQNQHLTTTAVGNFNFKLKVITSQGCKDSITLPATVFSLPQTEFTTNVIFGSPPLVVLFSNTSDSGNYTWNFGDGSPISSNVSPTHTYSDTGKFDITLTTITDFGCVSTKIHSIQVLLPYIDIEVESCNYVETLDAYEVSAIVRNLGNITIENFNINAYLQSKSAISEQANNLNLTPGNALNFKFSSKFLKDEFIPDYVCVEILKVNQVTDAVISNNENCRTIRNTSEIYSLYPNPTNDFITLPINATKEKSIYITIYDMYGKLIQENLSYSLKIGFNRITIDFSSMASGNYVIKITEGDNNEYQSVVKR